MSQQPTWDELYERVRSLEHRAALGTARESALENKIERWKGAARYHMEYGCRLSAALVLERESSAQAHAEVQRLQLAVELLEREAVNP